MIETIEITLEMPVSTSEPRHRVENPASSTPIFEEIVADTGFRPASRFPISQKKGKHVYDAG